MADKQIIETLRNIKDYCQRHDTCKDCTFHSCKIYDLFHELAKTPNYWVMGDIERIINENQ